MKKYIHVGYPKAGSTAIQRGFLGRHNQLFHLGCGASSNGRFWDDHGYVDEQVNVILEIDLRYRNSLAYEEEKVKAVFNSYFEHASKDRFIHAVGISNENLCFNWHGGIDICEKARRLYNVFGKETSILIVIRNQRSLIESLYKESIRFGYPGSFVDYLMYLWVYKDRNFTFEFCFSKVYDVYAKLFGVDNMHVFLFEDFREDSSDVVRNMSEAIGIDYYDLPLNVEYNKQLEPHELEVKRLINQRFPHTFSKGVYSPIDTHRFAGYFINELEIPIPDEEYFDYYSRKHFNLLAKNLASKLEVQQIDLSWENEYGKRLLRLYQDDNEIFFKLIGRQAHEDYSFL